VILPDTNILVYAYNANAPEHKAARSWFEQRLSDAEPVALTWATISGFLRITTNARIMEKPIRISKATEIIDQWLTQPAIRVIRPGERHWTILKKLLTTINLGGNLITNAHLAALAIEHDCELCSSDTDFARFPGLRWHNPLRP